MNIEHIDPRKPLNIEDFCTLFEQIPLLDDEKERVKLIYWPIYELCLNTPEVTPTEAWMATKNTFIAKEEQIKIRLQEQNKN